MAKIELHPACLTSDALLAACSIRTGRRRGPGGQHRNKVETAVTILHEPSGVLGEATERRSQSQNKTEALFRLRVNLALEVRSAPATDAPSSLWKSRCRGGRIAVSPSHKDFPALLAELLDVLHRLEMDVPAAAKTLNISTSQLVKLLKCEPRALLLVNRARQQRGLSPMR